MKKYYILSAAALAILASCSTKEEEFKTEPSTEPQVETVEMKFRAATEDSSSKTTLTPATGAVEWAVGDAVKFVYELDGTPGYATSDVLAAEDIDEGVATFTASVPADFAQTEDEYKAGGGSSLHLYAVSPSAIDVDYSTASSFYLTVPSTQDGSFENASIALAKWDKTNPSATLEFKNLCGLLKFIIADDDVRKVVLHSDDYIAGTMDITFTGPAVKNVSSGETAITVNVTGAGTYYVAVLPTDESKGIGINNIYVELLDSSDNLIGDKGSANPLVISRKQIRSIGTLATGLSDRLYFTQDGAGLEDGSSWDNALASTALAEQMATTSSINKSFYLAAGNYLVEGKNCTPAAGSTIKIYGGYPAAPSGKSLTGRNVSTNISKIYTTSNRAFWTQKGNWVFDGLTFTSTGYTGTAGGAAMLLLAGTESAIINNCKFDSSVVSTANSGVVRVAVAATFTKCDFTENSTKGSGGAMWVVSTGTATLKNCTFSHNSAVHGGAINVAGTLIADRCTFESNSVTQHGGAIVSNNANIKLNECIFIDNMTSGGSEPYAADLYLGGTTTAYVNASYFGQSTDSFTPATDKPHRILTGSSVNIGMNNCVISGPFGKSNQVNTLQGNSVIVNTTVYSQSGAACILAGSSNADGCRIINSIVSNGSANKYAFTANSSRYIQAYNSIYSVDGTSEGSFTATECLGGKYYGVFPDNSPWAQKYLGTAASLPGGGSIKAYVWDGVCDGFTSTSLASIKTLISGTNSVGSGFLTWLESDDLKVNGKEALSVDIRGVARNASAMWPGSYEQTSGLASAPAFNLK